MQLFVEHLTVIDSAYLHPEHGIVGESWIVDVTLHGDLDPQSMVMDFGHVKKQLKAAIDGSLDHTLIVARGDTGLTINERDGQLTLQYRFGEGATLTHRSPREAVSILAGAEVTSAALTDWLQAYVMQVVPANVSRVEIGLRHEDADPAYYHYAHGLKKHDGNCQRIAHGHRSRLMIWRDGARDEALERSWAARLNRRYFATQGDIVQQQNGQLQMGYTSPQGRFELCYPATHCIILPGDTTVECIAQWLAQQLAAEQPGHAFTARSYEGVHKGAIASA